MNAMRLHGPFCILLLAVILGGCTNHRLPSAPEKRNVILFLGDGMGVSTVTAARIFQGQRQGLAGEEHLLSFERFPNVALVKTYSTDAQVSDSAGTMTAIMTGEKTRIGVVSVSAEVSRNDCATALNHELPTLLEMAEDQGYGTGIISTTRITHATPAATFAHTPNRGWESDAELPDRAAAEGCRDIARQLVEFDRGNGIDVMMGGGRTRLLPRDMADPEYPDKTGMRVDGKNLVAQWLAAADGRSYVWHQSQFKNLVPDASGQVLGLFEPSHLHFEADRDPATEPSLAEMTRFAISRLQREPRGFFLMVEGGRIDHAHHVTNAYRALTDTIAMAEAVAVAADMTSPAETLILVTADHSHTLTISGYPRRGNPILGKVETTLGEMAKDGEGRPYTTLSYANGPGYQSERADLRGQDTTAPGYRQLAAIPMPVETHAGEDVAAYASGLNAEKVRGVMEQNRLFHVMREALNLQTP